MTHTSKRIQDGTRVEVRQETAILELGTIVGSSVEPITGQRSYTVRYDDDTQTAVPSFRVMVAVAR